MIDDFRALGVFVSVADAGSFSAAGRRLKLSTSVVSHHISRLETKLGSSLFFRSTRALSLTPEGEAMLGPARRMVRAGEEALDSLTDMSEEPVGALRVTMPAFGDRSSVHNAIWAFARTHPKVTLSLHSSDRQVDLVREGFDLGIRMGTLSDSSLMQRRIGTLRRVLVAAPAYLERRPPIRTIRDLQTCDIIGIVMLPKVMTLQRNGEEVRFEPEHSRVEVDSISGAKSAILAGLGVQHMPMSETEQNLADGSLVEVLPDWKLPDLGIYAVWPDGGPQKRLTRRLIDFLMASEEDTR